ncbi:hypothetical protein J6590_012333 [Homalodisca vitripennis]|nr:hypothetical protein J6590_012333 [Homalodisca vitripennis]
MGTNTHNNKRLVHVSGKTEHVSIHPSTSKTRSGLITDHAAAAAPIESVVSSVYGDRCTFDLAREGGKSVGCRQGLETMVLCNMLPYTHINDL